MVFFQRIFRILKVCILTIFKKYAIINQKLSRLSVNKGVKMQLLPNLNKQIRQDIINGKFHDILPSIRMLAQEYKAGESTIKLALKALKEDGFLTGHQGKCIRVNPKAVNNHFFQKNIIFFIKLPRLGLQLYSVVMESLREYFEISGANIHLISSLKQLKACRFEIDLLIAAETNDAEFQFISEQYPPEIIILLNQIIENYSCVGTDNFLAGYNAIKYLHQNKGHTNIGFLGKYLDYKTSHCKTRLEGAAAYFKEHPEINLVSSDINHFSDSASAIDDLFVREVKITAIFAAMDILAIGILSYAANKNISIPEQLAVLGFDNSPLCSYTVPALSTFQEDSDNISFALIKLAREKLQNNNGIKHELYCPQFIERNSV